MTRLLGGENRGNNSLDIGEGGGDFSSSHELPYLAPFSQTYRRPSYNFVAVRVSIYETLVPDIIMRNTSSAISRWLSFALDFPFEKINFY